MSARRASSLAWRAAFHPRSAMLPLTNIGTIALTLCRRPRRLFIGHRYSRFRRQDHSGRPQYFHCTISHRRSRPRAYGRVPQRVIAHRLRDCSRAGVRAASRGPIENQRIPQRSNMLVLRGRAFGSRIQWLLSACLHARDEFFLGPLTLASLRGEFSYWCT